MTANALLLVGLARKAGHLEIGEEKAGLSCRDKKAKLIVLASDASQNTVERMERSASQNGQIPCVALSCTKEELGRSVGKNACAAAAMTDSGLAAGLLRKLADEKPEQYDAMLLQMEQQAQRTARRQKKRAKRRREAQRGGSPEKK